MKKILVVVDSIDINHSSGSKANVSLIKNLQLCGFDVCVYHFSTTDIFIEGINTKRITTKKKSIHYLLSRIQRVFTRITKININPKIESWFGFSFTFFNDVESFYSKLKKEKTENYDWVLTLSYAGSFRPHAALLKLPKWHSKWLSYVHDPYPMHSYPRPYDWVESGHQFKRNFFLNISKDAKYMVYPSQYLAEWMESYYHEAKGKAIIIPHQISPFQSNIIDNSIFGSNDEFRILHAGNLMSARNPTHLLEAFELFVKKNPNAPVKLIFVGKIDEYAKAFAKASTSNSKIIALDKYLPFEQVNDLQHQVTVNVILEAKGSFSPFLPGKFPHCISANKPILLLGPFYSESKRLLGNEYEYWSEIDDVEKIYDLITKLYDNWTTLKNEFKLNRSDLEFYLSFNNLKKTILKLKN